MRNGPVTNPRGYKHRYCYDAFGQMTKVEELNASHALYATTTYAYDVLGNLKQVVDAAGNTTTMNYDWLSRKTSMSDPDMGSWTYAYDGAGNLTSQTDAKGQTITIAYDALDRPTGKTYPAGSGMTDGSGTMAWMYDTRGRLVQETRTVDSVNYITGYTYDSADRLLTVTYPTDEVVTNAYNGRGLPYTVSDLPPVVVPQVSSLTSQLVPFEGGRSATWNTGHLCIGQCLSGRCCHRDGDHRKTGLRTASSSRSVNVLSRIAGKRGGYTSKR